MTFQLDASSQSAAHEPTRAPNARSARSGTFTDNLRLPVHRWFRYSAGFSAEWVAEVVRQSKSDPERSCFLDPFVGSGTASIAAASTGMPAFGFESHPFVFRIARAKSIRCRDRKELRDLAERVLVRAQADQRSNPASTAPLLLKCFSPEVLAKLESLRDAYHELRDSDEPEWELIWLALTSILRSCSGVGTAQWQYVLPNKTKARVADPVEAFQARINEFALDIDAARSLRWTTPTILLTDAREPDYSGPKISLVITSPPYPNNYDYADATRLEMTFWQEITGWGDLQDAVRRFLIRSCSQHSAAEKLSLEDLVSLPELAPIHDELAVVTSELDAIRHTKGGKKTYHTMVAAYFADLARTWIALREVCAESAKICFVVGDSAPYGVYVPVDEWLGRLAIAAGFSSYRFEKLRDRNIKWKNRKHRVPLKEGRLWVE